MKFFERDHWNLKDNWGTWEDEKTESPEEIESSGVPGFASAAYRVGVAIALTREVVVKGVRFKSIGDEIQGKILKTTNELQQKAGVQGEILLPTFENVQAVFSDVYDAIDEELPDDVPPYYELNEIKAQETMNYVRRVESGDFDKPEIRPEEEVIVRRLIKGVGVKSAFELSETVKDYVYGRELDILSAEKTNRFARRDEDFRRGKKSFDNFVPKKWLMVDFVTSWLMTPRERKEMKNIIWTITPKELIVKNISTNEDVTRIPLERFSTEDEEPVYIQDGIYDTADVLRRGSTPLFQRFTNMILEEKLGGIVVLRDYRRDEVLAKLPVRAHIATGNSLGRLGEIAQGYERTEEITEKAVDEVDVVPGDEIRRNVIIKNLPTVLILEIDARLNEDGTVDWEHFKGEIDKRIDEKNAQRLNVTVLASNSLDEEGNTTRESYEEKIGEIRREIKYLKREKKKLKIFLKK